MLVTEAPVWDSQRADLSTAPSIVRNISMKHVLDRPRAFLFATHVDAEGDEEVEEHGRRVEGLED